MQGTTVMLSVELSNDELLTRAVEAVSRAAAGLALEGLTVAINVYPTDSVDPVGDAT